MSDMRVIDKYRLHPFGGYASDPKHARAVREAQERWEALTPEEREKARKELLEAYPPEPDGAGR